MPFTNWPKAAHFRELISAFEVVHGGNASDTFEGAFRDQRGRDCEPSPNETCAQVQLQREVYHSLLNVVNEQKPFRFVSRFFPDFVSPVLSDWAIPIQILSIPPQK